MLQIANQELKANRLLGKIAKLRKTTTMKSIIAVSFLLFAGLLANKSYSYEGEFCEAMSMTFKNDKSRYQAIIYNPDTTCVYIPGSGTPTTIKYKEWCKIEDWSFKKFCPFLNRQW